MFTEICFDEARTYFSFISCSALRQCKICILGYVVTFYGEVIHLGRYIVQMADYEEDGHFKPESWHLDSGNSWLTSLAEASRKPSQEAKEIREGVCRIFYNQWGS
jgi:hypothetical protein